MTIENKLELIAETLDIDAEVLKPEMILADMEEYDSLARLSLIVMIDEECGRHITADTVRSFVTVQDILDQMGD